MLTLEYSKNLPIFPKYLMTKIDELITPKKTSYTMSGEETSGNVKEDGEIKEAGRNKSDEITDSTEKAKESE